MTKEELISQITSTISANGNQDITGTKLQEVLVSIVDALYSAIDEAIVDESPEDFTELILQTLGTRVDATMSQKAITDALTALNYGINAIPVFARIEHVDAAQAPSIVNSTTELPGEIVYVIYEHPYFQEGFYWKASDNKYYTWFGDAHLYKVDVNTPVRYNKLFECAEDGKQYVIVAGSTTAKPNLVMLGTGSGSAVVESNDIPKFNGMIKDVPDIIPSTAPTYEGIYFSELDCTFVAKLGTDYYASWDTSHLYKDGPGVIESRLFEYNKQLYMYDGKALNLLSNAPKIDGYTYIGTATPSTTPVTLTEDSKVFYIATEEGAYANFGLGNISELSVIKSDGSWKAEGLGVDLLSRAAIENHKNIENSRLFPNVFKTEGISANTFLDLNNGTTYDRNNYSTSDYIPVLPNKEYVFFRKSVSVVFYDINLKYVSYKTMSESGSAVVPDNAYYARISYYTSWASDTSKIYVGLPPENLDRQIGTDKIADKAITAEKIADRAITAEKIADMTITAEKTSFFTYGKNLCNSESSDFIHGKFLDSNGGTINSTSAFITPYIRFTQEMGKLIVSANRAMVTGGYQHCVYDSNLNFIKAYSANLGAVPWEEGVAYVRFSGGGSGKNVQVEIGDKVTPYEPFSAYLKDEYLDFERIKDKIEENLSVPGLEVTMPAQSAVGQDGISAYLENLNSGTLYTIADYPKYLKKTGVMAAYMSFSGVFDGYIDVGFFGTPSQVGDKTTYEPGIYVRVTDSQYQILVRSSLYTTKDHNLAIDKFLNVSYSRDTDGSIHVILATLGGIYVSEALNINAPIESYGQPSIYTSALNLTGLKLNLYNRDFRKPIWVVGDSYVSLYDVRWTYQMQVTMGIKNWLLQGLAGGGSVTMLQDLKRSLALGTPKFLIWCLGMNDSYDVWLSSLEELKTICKEKGIELVLATIPTVPGRSKEEITQYVRSSGYRYIDFYEALGATPDGTWYDGYLEENEDSSKRVHTTELGAKIQAARVLVDFPEIIDFNA